MSIASAGALERLTSIDIELLKRLSVNVAIVWVVTALGFLVTLALGLMLSSGGSVGDVTNPVIVGGAFVLQFIGSVSVGIIETWRHPPGEF